MWLRQDGSRFTYLIWDRKLSWPCWWLRKYPRCFICSQTLTLPSSICGGRVVKSFYILSYVLYFLLWRALSCALWGHANSHTCLVWADFGSREHVVSSAGCVTKPGVILLEFLWEGFYRLFFRAPCVWSVYWTGLLDLTIVVRAST